jgi:hypothetical protein
MRFLHGTSSVLASCRAGALLAVLCFSTQVLWPSGAMAENAGDARKIGVLYLVHGGARSLNFSNFFDGGIQMASYDENSSTYQNVIWQPENWHRVVPLADRQQSSELLGLIRKYSFQLGRMGNLEPAAQITEAQVASLQAALDSAAAPSTTQFVVDWVGWIAGSDDVSSLPFPRFIYNRDGESAIAMRYCGSPTDGGAQPDGRWPLCDPERYNVDGPVDRLLRAGVEKIIVVDTAVGGIRFSKGLDVYRMLGRARDAALRHTNRSVPIIWANDYTGFMMDAYSKASAHGSVSTDAPGATPKVALENRGNPVTDDPAYAAIVVDGIVRAMSDSVSPADTGVLLYNHGIFPGNEVFDPKIDDTIRLHENLEDALLTRHPTMSAENIVGAWEGVKQMVDGVLQRTREMRGEDLGHAYLYGSNAQMPPGKWGLRYWEALERLKDNGVRHIVVVFPQVIVTTTTGKVGLPNQIAQEIGYRGFVPVSDLDIPLWPAYDGPFANHWPPDADRLCYSSPADRAEGVSHDCCYRLGGCLDGNAYPAPRQTPVGQPLSRVDPEIVFDVPPFGHLGYDPALGSPSNDFPVQNQYTGTWSIWVPMDDSPRLAEHLASVVLSVINNPQAREL